MVHAALERLLGGKQAEAEAQEKSWRNVAVTASIVVLCVSVCCCWCVILLCGPRIESGRGGCDLEKIAMWIAQRSAPPPLEEEAPKKRKTRRKVGPGNNEPEQIVLGKLKGRGTTKLGKGKMAKAVEAKQAERAVGAAPTGSSSSAQVKAALAARV